MRTVMSRFFPEPYGSVHCSGWRNGQMAPSSHAVRRGRLPISRPDRTSSLSNVWGTFVGITWNSVGGGVTWDGPVRGMHRRFMVAAVLLATAAGAAGMPHAHADNAGGTLPLPDLLSVEQSVGAPLAWSMGATGRGVDVALIDTGVTPVQGLTGDKLVYGPDLSFDSQDSHIANVDGYGHGTAMAGIIAGNDGVAGGYRGVAPQARIVSVKVGAANGAVDVSQIIAGIDWVTEHAHDPGMNIRVLNISLGTDSTQYYGSDPLAAAAENAWKHGIVVVAAVGNDGSANTVADPASDPYVVAVGATDPMGTEQISDDPAATFSNRGNGSRRVDLVAPGSYVVGLRDPGSYLDQTYPAARVGDRDFRGSGPSQPAAMVSGAAADVLWARPGMTPGDGQAALPNTA